MRRHDLAEREFPPDAYVFGDAIGRRVKSVQEAWRNAANKAGLKDFQLRHLQHEAGSRFNEAGVRLLRQQRARPLQRQHPNGVAISTSMTLRPALGHEETGGQPVEGIRCKIRVNPR